MADSPASATSSLEADGSMTAPSGVPNLDVAVNTASEVAKRCEAFRQVFDRLMKEIGKVIVGQDDIVKLTLIGLFAEGHILLEGVPGLGKTLLIRTLSEVLDLPFNRIQFTPDLMPADIVGTNIVMDNRSTGKRTMEFRPGPIFAQIVLADEINRATPKTQAALLEAMQERRVTVATKTYDLKRPFLVLATQNPIEQEGTYALPEAQLDRFLLKLVVPYASRQEMTEILARTTAGHQPQVERILDGSHILQGQQLIRQVVAAEHVTDYAIRLILATHPGSRYATRMTNRYVKVGCSPRGAQAIILAAKVLAIVEGRYAIAFKDVQRIALPALRHRIMVNFEAEAEGVTSDDIIDAMIAELPTEVDLESIPGADALNLNGS